VLKVLSTIISASFCWNTNRVCCIYRNKTYLCSWTLLLW